MLEQRDRSKSAQGNGFPQQREVLRRDIDIWLMRTVPVQPRRDEQAWWTDLLASCAA